MERYAEYKDSGIEWIGEIPSKWEVTNLGYYSQMIVPMRDKPTAFEGDIPWIKIEDVEGKYIDSSKSSQNVTFELVNKMNLKICPVGTVLCTCSCNLGAAVIVKKPLTFNQTFIGIVPGTKLDTHYLFYLIQSNKERLQYLSIGAIQQYLSRTDFEHLKLAFPAFSIQQRIADYLDRKTVSIDAVIADKQKLVELLKEKRQATISEAVTKGLDKTAKMKDSSVDWIGDVPKHWDVLPLFAAAKENRVRNEGMACNNLLSLSYGKIIQKDIDTNFGLLPASFESYQIVQPGYTVLRLTDLQNDKRSLRTGYANETGIITSAYLGLVPSERLESKYFTYLLHAYDLIKIYYGLGGGLRQSLKFSDVKRLPVLIPPMPEQKRIVEYIDRKAAKIEGLIVDINAQIEKLKQYRQIVIHDAVTGKIKVTEG